MTLFEMLLVLASVALAFLIIGLVERRRSRGRRGQQ